MINSENCKWNCEENASDGCNIFHFLFISDARYIYKYRNSIFYPLPSSQDRIF
jgi:hypothetical protein